KNIIQMAGNWIKVLALQTPVDKLIPFTIKLMDQPVSISKHFIRIFVTAANINERHSVLMNLWRTEKHLTIRTLVFNKIFDSFVTNPSHNTWLLLNECIDGLTADDKEGLSTICCLKKIPNEYIVNYVRKLFAILTKFQRLNDKIDPEFIWSHIVRLLQLEKLFIDILKNQWDIPDPLEPNVFPANYMVDTLMIDILCHIEDNNIKNQFIDVTLNSFRSVLSPLQAPLFYSYYIFVSLYRGNEMSRDEYVKQIGKIIPSLIDTFSVGFISELGKILSRCLELFWEDIDLREEITIDIIEGLLKLNIEHAITLAGAIPMLERIKKNNERYTNILQTLRKQKNPATIAHASMRINSRTIYNVRDSTPGEKYKILNRIIRKIIAESDSKNDRIKVELSSKWSEILIPSVKLEIYKILRQLDEIVERLKSNDSSIFSSRFTNKMVHAIYILVCTGVVDM
ncbi:hypothetical protein PV325_006237, partial [Microctonus aethiopoides]